jgi:hypothetical protein
VVARTSTTLITDLELVAVKMNQIQLVTLRLITNSQATDTKYQTTHLNLIIVRNCHLEAILQEQILIHHHRSKNKTRKTEEVACKDECKTKVK